MEVPHLIEAAFIVGGDVSTGVKWRVFSNEFEELEDTPASPNSDEESVNSKALSGAYHAEIISKKFSSCAAGDEETLGNCTHFAFPAGFKVLVCTPLV